MEDEAFSKYLEGRHSYLLKHLTLAKNNAMNVCSSCEMKFYVTDKRADSCQGERKHEAKYDFTISDDVT